MSIQDLLMKYKDNNEERFFKEIFDKKEYSPLLEKNADVVLDIGACAGEFSAYIYDRANIIYAIEPFSKYFRELEDNIKEFDLNKIKPFNIAIGGYNGDALITTDSSRGGNSIVESGNNTESVKMTTLATFMSDHKIAHVNILKIDIENYEDYVFSASDFNQIAEKIDLIIGEHLNGKSDEILRLYGFERIVLPENQNCIYEHTTAH